jgi:hypothetical protein
MVKVIAKPLCDRWELQIVAPPMERISERLHVSNCDSIDPIQIDFPARK